MVEIPGQYSSVLCQGGRQRGRGRGRELIWKEKKSKLQSFVRWFTMPGNNDQGPDILLPKQDFSTSALVKGCPVHFG